MLNQFLVPVSVVIATIKLYDSEMFNISSRAMLSQTTLKTTKKIKFENKYLKIKSIKIVTIKH